MTQERVSAWKRGLQLSPTLAKVAAATSVKQPTWKQLQFVQCSKGIVWDPTSQDVAIQGFWKSWESYASEKAEEKMVPRFFNEYTLDIDRSHRRVAPPILGDDLRKAKAKSAASPDGWRRTEVAALPTCAWRKLVELLGAREHAHEMPPRLSEQWIASILKAEMKEGAQTLLEEERGAKPARLRPYLADLYAVQMMGKTKVQPFDSAVSPSCTTSRSHPRAERQGCNRCLHGLDVTASKQRSGDLGLHCGPQEVLQRDQQEALAEAH